jgi:hypothetical protein
MEAQAVFAAGGSILVASRDAEQTAAVARSSFKT